MDLSQGTVPPEIVMIVGLAEDELAVAGALEEAVAADEEERGAAGAGACDRFCVLGATLLCTLSESFLLACFNVSPRCDAPLLTPLATPACVNADSAPAWPQAVADNAPRANAIPSRTR